MSKILLIYKHVCLSKMEKVKLTAKIIGIQYKNVNFKYELF